MPSPLPSDAHLVAAQKARETTRSKARYPQRHPEKHPSRAMPLTRRYDVACVDASTTGIRRFTSMAPMLPLFEDAFGAVARGTLVATGTGTVAVEDPTPGTLVQTADNGLQPVLWIGAMSIVPGAPQNINGLMRVTADSFGLGRPMPDLMLAAGARLLRRPTQARPDQFAGLVPITELCDGDSIIEITPPAPVTVFHLVFERHQILCANGLELESYHPGLHAEMSISQEMMSIFLALFPHVRQLDDFGPLAYPRLEIDHAMSA